MNSATQALLKMLSNLQAQETQINNQLSACEKEILGWKKDLETLLKQKAEIQLAISILEGDLSESDTKSKNKKASGKRSNT